MLGTHNAALLSAYIKAWGSHPFDVMIGTIYPRLLEIDIMPQPKPGQDLIIVHGTYKYSFINVDFNVWLGIKPLDVWVSGVYASDLYVDFRMGGAYKLYIDLPMTTGYRDLFVVLKPASRIVSTIIPVYTMEIHNLYISINQGWPCGFWSTYTLLNVTFKAAYVLAFSAIFKVIHGSGFPLLGVYINRTNFSSYINAYNIHISLPADMVYTETIISDVMPVTYQNQFDNITQEIMQIRFSWPRIRLYSGETEFSVELFSYKGDLFMDMSVELFALRAEVPTMPTSQPIVQRIGYQDPVWPAVFQVKEIELWEDDPPELIRLIDVTFGEQVTQYYWLSAEQRAYKKNDYEQWSLMARGYLPHSEYSGQIDYVSLHEISDMSHYTTIDAAIKALIANFIYKDKTTLAVNFSVTGAYTAFNVVMDIWGRNRLSNLTVNLEPAHPCDLSIKITCV
jgi:hypothetical protein